MKQILLLFTVLCSSFFANAQSWYPLGPDDNNQPVPTHGYSFATALSASGTQYIFYGDMLRNGRATVRKFEGGQWQYVGLPAFSPHPGVGGSGIKYPGIVINPAGIPYVMYCSGTNGRLSVSRFTGGAWSSVGPAAVTAGEVFTAVIAMDNAGTPYIGYKEMDVDGKIFIKKFDGTAWVDVGPASGINLTGNASGLSIDISDAGTPYIAYTYNDTLVAAKFNGTTWEKVGNTEMKETFQCSIKLDNYGDPYLTAMINHNIVIKKYHGNTWTDISPGNTLSMKLPQISFDQLNNIYLTYVRDAVDEYLFIRKYSAGVWTSLPTIFESNVYHIGLMVNNNNEPVIVGLTGSYIDKTFSRKFNGSNWVTLGEEGLSKYTSLTGISLVANNGIPYILNSDKAGGSFSLLKRFTSGQWEQVGDTLHGISSARFAMDASATPCIVYPGNDGDIKARKMVSGIWTTLPDVSAAGAIPAINIDASGTPYVMFSDANYINKATVKKFDGSSWVTVGQAGFTPIFLSYSFITFDNNNVPYIATQARVYKFTGTVWEAVGSTFSGGTYSMTIDFDQSNVPWVSYAGSDRKVRVQKFTGTAWADVVTGGIISDGESSSVKLLFNNNNVPYVAYTEKAYQNNFVERVSVKKFNGTSFEFVGTRDVSAGQTAEVDLALLHGTIPVILYNSTQIYARSFSNWALPVTLTQFTAWRVNNTAQIRWTTLNESALKEYAVERSLDGIGFSDVGFIAAKNETGEHAYNFVDDIAHITAKKIFYRLRLVEKDGKFSYSKIITLTIDTKQQATIYPNPVKDVLHINTGTAVYRTVIIHDILGRVVLTRSLSSGISAIPVQKLIPGRYSIIMYSDNDRITQSFIKE